MALLQISEPDGAQQDRKKKFVAGIDLGTTNSLIGSVVNHEVELFLDVNGASIIPSVVNYRESGDPLVGSVVGSNLNKSGVIISSVKRLMGKALSDFSEKALSVHLLEEESKGRKKLVVDTPSGKKSPVEISAEILIHLKKIAESASGQLEGVVLTVPAHFDDAQRQATKDSAKLAGLEVMRLMNEPTAAALAYGLDKKKEGIFLVYDLGGGTFDVSLLKLEKEIFKVIATGGNTSLGGDDFDEELAKLLLAGKKIQIGELTKYELSSFLEKVKNVKEGFFFKDNIDEIAEFTWEFRGKRLLSFKISEKEFINATKHLVDETIDICKSLLFDSGLDRTAIDEVVFVGGSTRLNVIRKAVEKFFGRKPRVDINPDEAVVVGAALQADLLVGNRGEGDDWLLLDVLPLSLGLETMGGLVEKIIPRNSPIPVSKAQEFTTFKDGQTAMIIHVVQGERELVRDCRSLARFLIDKIPPMISGQARITVSFQVDADGLLAVEAKENETGVTTSVEVKPSFGLDKDEIEKIISESFSHASKDKNSRIYQETLVELEMNLDAVRTAIKVDGDLLDASESKNLDDAIKKGEKLLREKIAKIEVFKLINDEINLLALPLVERRMNRAIGKAIVGKNIKNVSANSSCEEK
ncbi:MAG: Fe-S protein assembly chaperone HscA [Betaproteobacteria bacterium TMED82]|nr:MAG: Fe-S protein assembly chaperone HscA [Betaproteobacteria bacterium TMED82]|tara:strand:- start:8536 stop:10452 length:1917 start_codon:yes stop_codon:yes gene_type:complete